MTDKEIGELWTWYVTGKLLPDIKNFSLTTDYTKQLIRTLVEERAMYIRATLECYSRESCEFIPDALRDFGIDPETWVKP